MSHYLFIDPLDVSYLRGNKLFGEAGQHSEALMPPWPSLAAGAIRSRMLSDHEIDLANYGHGAPLPEPLATSLGYPDAPGRFRLTWFGLGQRTANATIEPLLPLPADLVALGEGLGVHYLHPTPLPRGLKASYPLEKTPLLRLRHQAKPESGYWLTAEGVSHYLAGRAITMAHLVSSSALWRRDARLGIGLETASRVVETGKLYTSEAVSLAASIGFVAGVEGADGLLPEAGLLRWGGDGRGAAVSTCQVALPEPDWERIAASGRFRLLLTTPGLFTAGWRPPGLDAQQRWPEAFGHARLVSAASPRTDVISGWNLAQQRPKPAQRSVGVGAVYWFEGFNGDIERLKGLLQTGLWPLFAPTEIDAQRQSEGFNNIAIAPWAAEA